MEQSPSRSAAARSALTAAVDAVAALPLDELDHSEIDDLLVSLSRSADRLAGEVARVAALAEARGTWAAAGAASMPSHLSNLTGTGYGAARSSVELGRAMASLPSLDAAVRSGEVSPAAARWVADAVDDDGLAEVADQIVADVIGLKPVEARHRVDAWRTTAQPADEAIRRRRAVDGRHLRFTPQGDGTTHLEGIVPDHVAGALRRVLKHLADGQRLDESDRTTAQRRVDALADLVAAFERGEVTGGRNLPRLVVTTSLADLEARGLGLNADGDIVQSSEIDRLCCDSVIHSYVFDQQGATLRFGRGRRTASPHQFLALSVRDGGCRHPGCDRPPDWCEAHHLREFAARGGRTDLDEMALLCHHHHHALHDDGWTLAGTPERLVFTGPDGRRLVSTLSPPARTNRAA